VSPSDHQETSFDTDYYVANGQDADRIALQFYARIARRMVPEGGQVLDFGAGTGFFCRRLSRFATTSALDVSPTARQRIVDTSPTTTVYADVAAVPCRSFDLVTALHVLEHVPDPNVTLAAFAAWLRPGGRLLFVVPNPDGIGHRLKKADWFAYRDPTHCSLLSQADWLAAAEGAGFQIDRAGADGLWDPPYVSWLPAVVQKVTFGAPAAGQVALGRLVLPPRSGECLVVRAQRP
jgi:SAM-dependent methyltransferase